MTASMAIDSRVRSQTLLSAAPFLLWFVVSAFLPDTLVPKPVFFGVPMRASDLMVPFAGLVSFAGWFLAGQVSPRRSHWHRGLPLWFTLIVGYAAISTAWAGLDQYNSRAMLYSLLLAATAFLLPFSVIASLSPELVRSVTRWVALGLAVVGLVYCAVSFFGLSVRSELGHFYTGGFGLERVKGPMFESSTGHIILLPAAAFLLQDWFDRPRHALTNAIGLVALSITLIGLGSRFALIVVGLFLVLITVTSRGARSFLLTGVALAGLAVSAGVVFHYATGERLQSFSDPQRSETYETSLRAVQEREVALNISGSGYGSVWPWYMREWEMGERISRGDMLVATDYGRMLYQPHSVLLLLGVELGMVGLLFFLMLWVTLGRMVLRAVIGRQNAFAAIGVACAALGMFADLILFKGPRVSALWWFFFLSALAMAATEPTEARQR